MRTKMTTDFMRWTEPSLAADSLGPPTIKNHSVTHFNGHLYCFGGYDGEINHMTLLLYSIRQQKWIQPSADRLSGTPPPGRNGHTATLATEDEENGRIIIIGGWLGTGPYAASDMHVLDVTDGGRQLRWYQPPVRGTAPGPCNMHSADYVASRKEVYVFRGGNGREYLNDLHALDVHTFEWRKVETTGPAPQQRANHSSAVIDDELFIFGGWNGKERLNDVYILDTTTSTWTCPHVGGVLPQPRAGMTLTALRGRLYLFGGSGSSSKCFQDLQILDRKQMIWLDVMQNDNDSKERRSNAADDHWKSWHLQQRAANPNDEEAVPTAIVQGQGPGRRAGHTATAVNRKIYVFGGSCGSAYLNDFFVLDTDPPPVALVSEPASLQLLERRMRHFYNDPEFSDVVFLVEGQRVYGHKIVLSIVSDIFRAMFTGNFRESEAGAEIEIPDCSHQSFVDMLGYIYCGTTPHIGPDAIESDIQRVIDLLRISDQFFLNHLKENCERALQPTVNADTVEYMLQVAQETNAMQLIAICEHFIRNQNLSEN